MKFGEHSSCQSVIKVPSQSTLYEASIRHLLQQSLVLKAYAELNKTPQSLGIYVCLIAKYWVWSLVKLYDQLPEAGIMMRLKSPQHPTHLPYGWGISWGKTQSAIIWHPLARTSILTIYFICLIAKLIKSVVLALHKYSTIQTGNVSFKISWHQHFCCNTIYYMKTITTL